MRCVLSIVAGLAASVLVANSAVAQVAPACAGLEARFARQDKIDEAYRCDLERTPFATQRRARALRRCGRADRRRLRATAGERAAALEHCVADRIDRRATTPAARGRLSPAQGDGLRKAQDGTLPGRTGEGRTSGEIIEDLLARGPRLSAAPEDHAPARLRERAFRSGLVWSYAGPVAGMHCVQWREPSDPHNWDDNYLCTERDVGFRWSFRGPILGRGLKCIQVREKSDPHDWHDNFFCWPRDLAVTFRFSSTGRIWGQHCLAIVEPSDPHTWRDNYLCHVRRGG